MSKKTIDVAIGVIIRRNRCLIARRPQAGHLEGLWEFPGGKFLAGESAEDCLHREIYEELGLKIDIDRSLSIIDHSYPDRDLRLHFFLCHPAEKERSPEETPEMLWVPVKNLDQYSFPEANAPILQFLKDF